MQNVFEKLVSNLVVAALVPSMTFMIIVSIIYSPIIPPTILSRMNLLSDQPGVMLFVCGLLLTFLLRYASELIYNIYSGQYFPSWFPSQEKAKAKELRVEIQANKEQLAELENETPKNNMLCEYLIKHNEYLIYQYHLLFSIGPEDDIDYILPTRLGNILASAEKYAERYGIDPLIVWPRLRHVIPTENWEKIEDANNQMSYHLKKKGKGPKKLVDSQNSQNRINSRHDV